MAGGWIAPFSKFAVTSGNTFPLVYSGAGANSKHDVGMGVLASIGANSTWRMRFQMPPSIPTGTFKLLLLSLASATTGNAIVQPQWIMVYNHVNPSTVTLAAEASTTISWTSTNTNVSTIVKNVGGTAYVTGDTIALNTGTAVTSQTAKAIVTASGGVVSTVNMYDAGVYSANPTATAGATTALTGVGTGLTVNTTVNTAGDADKYLLTKISLVAIPTPVAADVDKVLVMDLVFVSASWTLAQNSLWQAFIGWE